MVKRVGGFRRKTRQKLSRKGRVRGKIPIRKYLQTFAEDQKVQLVADSFFQAGMYHPRYHGKVGVVAGQQGECYLVRITDGKTIKNLVVHPVHLKAM